jgi:signal transduction histidine kinase
MPAPEPRPTRLQDVVDDILWLNREQCNARGIQLGWSRCDTVAPMPLDVNLIEPALLNIVKNAVEAIDERNARDGSSGGAIRVELEDLGERVRLSVIDSGGLLEDGQAQRVFTPFFSTKRGGQGIGLMFVREVLQRHGASCALAPAEMGETRFDIWFPAA